MKKNSDYYGIGNDEYKYYKTTDNGKTWSVLGIGNGSLVIKDDRMIIDGGFSDDNLATIKEGKEGDLSKDGDSIIIKNDDGIYKSKDGEEWERLGPRERLPTETDPLLYLLNDVIVPQLTNMLTDENDIGKLNYGEYEGITTFFTNSELYKTKLDGIDYVADVGMQPFSAKDLKEYKELEDVKNQFMKSLSEEDPRELKIDKMLKENKSLKKAFYIIDLKLNNVKTFMLKTAIDNIEKTNESYEGISESSIDLLKNFYEIRKGTEASIVGTIINSIFEFNNSKKMALLKMSIIETARMMKENLNFKLNNLRKKYNGNIITDKNYGIEEINNCFSFNLIDEWFNGLDNSIQKYYAESIKNIYSMTEEEDKDLIFTAANIYKEDRGSLILNAANILDGLPDQNQSTNTSLANLTNELNKLAENLHQTIIKEKDKDKLIEYYEEYSLSNKKMLEDNKNIFIKIIDEYCAEFSKKLEDLKIEYLSYNDFDEYLEDYTPDLIDRVYNYYEDIISKFKSRCIELYKLSGDEAIDEYVMPYINLEEEVHTWVVDYIIHNGNDNAFPSLDNKETIYSANELNKVIKRAWNGARNLL